MTTQNGRAFNEWLRTQLKAKKMSQRQLAQQSGVDHSTISRLIRGDRMPSLGTATKLARGLRELRDDADTTQYLGLVASGSMNPTARVEYALRADDLLTEPQVRQIMEYYLAVRIRRYGRSFQPDGSATATSTTERGADRTLTRPAGPVRQMSSSNDPVGVGAGGIRPVIRATGREPGRY
jgi:transcriptional regulator with XRE-family HTH domain